MFITNSKEAAQGVEMKLGNHCTGSDVSNGTILHTAVTREEVIEGRKIRKHIGSAKNVGSLTMKITKLHHVVANSARDFFEVRTIEFIKKRFAISWDGFANYILAAINAVVDSIERFELIIKCDLHYLLLYLIFNITYA